MKYINGVIIRNVVVIKEMIELKFIPSCTMFETNFKWELCVVVTVTVEDIGSDLTNDLE